MKFKNQVGRPEIEDSKKRKKNIITLRLNDYELEELKELCKILNTNRTNLIKNAYEFYKTEKVGE